MQRLQDADLPTLIHDGFVVKPAFFDADEVGYIREVVLRLRPTAKPHKKPARKWLMTSPSRALRERVHVRVRNDLVYLSRVAQDCGFRDFARRFFAKEAWLDHIMSIESPPSADPITSWHTDGASGAGTPHLADRFTVKFFVYLNDIDASASAFSYLRGSNRLVTAIRRGIVRGKIAPFNTILVSELLQALHTTQVVEYLSQCMSLQEIDGFITAVETVNAATPEPDPYSLRGAAGTLVVFDDRGVHRGGVPRLRERSMLRYNYLPSYYWRRNYGLLHYGAQRASMMVLPKSIAAHW